VETDNFGRDYPMEKFLNLPLMTKEHAERIAQVINNGFYENSSRYWKVVPDNYVLDDKGPNDNAYQDS
jgi:predicted YcjX-like family ATPase